MAATGWLIRRRLRRRWLALVPVGLITMLGVAATVVAAGAADRTGNAYSDYLERAEVGDVSVNPTLSSTDIDSAIRTLPGVRSVTRDALFAASLDEGEPRTLGDALAADADIQVRGSADGRYTAMDRPAIDEGRTFTGQNQVLVSKELAAERALHVGLELPVAFWSPAEELLLDPDTVVTPIGVERLTVVGIVTLSDEVLPDDVFPKMRVIVSPDVAARYDCLPGARHPEM